jgi:NADH-quinone oxidoreductase subunit L
VSSELHHFLEPTFADSELYEGLEPSASRSGSGCSIGAVIGLAGIAIAWRLYGTGGNAAALQARFARRTSSS